MLTSCNLGLTIRVSLRAIQLVSTSKDGNTFLLRSLPFCFRFDKEFVDFGHFHTILYDLLFLSSRAALVPINAESAFAAVSTAYRDLFLAERHSCACRQPVPLAGMGDAMSLATLPVLLRRFAPNL